MHTDGKGIQQRSRCDDDVADGRVCLSFSLCCAAIISRSPLLLLEASSLPPLPNLGLVAPSARALSRSRPFRRARGLSSFL